MKYKNVDPPPKKNHLELNLNFFFCFIPQNLQGIFFQTLFFLLDSPKLQVKFLQKVSCAVSDLGDLALQL